jgi:hypothetical protein
MKVNGKFIPEIDINVEKMYQTGIMKKWVIKGMK